jgi:hemolysin III
VTPGVAGYNPPMPDLHFSAITSTALRPAEPRRCWLREPFCGLSHGAGVALSVAGIIVLMVLARGRPWHMAGFAVYGATLVLLYTASTLYHSLHVSPRDVNRLMRFDQAAIYLLIAGTYTPLCLLMLPPVWGWSLLAVEWGLALGGIALLLLSKRVLDIPRMALYIIMGWLIVVAFGPVRQTFPLETILLLIGGGILYSIGTVVFAADRPHLWPGRFSAHDLWHLFVLGGSGCHYAMMITIAAVPAR